MELAKCGTQSIFIYRNEAVYGSYYYIYSEMHMSVYIYIVLYELYQSIRS